MTRTAYQLSVLALSALMALATLAGMNSIATGQYARVDSRAMAPYGQTHVAVQHVTVIGHRA